jgi:uncharacterized phage protein (TIGR02218 family)
MRAVTFQPGYILSQLQALLATRQFVVANCYTITPREGDIVRLCDVQEDVSIVEWGQVIRQIYFARQAVISGLTSTSSVGAEVDEQEISIAYADGALFQNWRPWPEALLMGRLDGATISRDWAIAAAWGQPWMAVTRMFAGRVSELDSVGRSVATLKVKSDLERLNVQMPRDRYSLLCRNILGDARCGVNLPSLAVIGTVGASPTRTKLPWASAASTYAFGKIHITNGDSVTRVRTVLKADGANLYLTYPLDFDPIAGLEFTAYPGCSRKNDRCPDFHGVDWIKRFAGTPYIPVAETAF